MKPVAIGVDHAFNNIFTDREAIAGREDISGVVPRLALDFEQMDVSFELPVVEQGVRKFMQQRDVTAIT